MINSVDELLLKLEDRGVKLSAEEISELRETDRKYPIRISDYYFNLIDFSNPDCPIRKQCFPSKDELINERNYEVDPLNEGKYCEVPHLAHKYYDRAAFFASDFCSMYCRHCTRKNTVIRQNPPTEAEFAKVLDYLRNHPEIKDVLVTGGDPLVLPLETLEHYLCEIRKIEFVETIRIGTRLICADPEKITDELADMLAKYHPVWVFTQFNHPKELTKEAAEACDRLLRRGIPLGNQSVFLKGINDNEETLEQLLRGLIKMRVRPYYLYQCDKVLGTEHFSQDYKKATGILEKLRYKVPGYAIPKFIIDADGENGGKVTIEENHILEETDDYLILKGRKENETTKYYKR